MPEPHLSEREALLAQLRELSGFQSTALRPAPHHFTASQTVLPRLGALEQRRLRPHLERLAMFKAEQGRLPSAGPAAAAPGERSLGAWLWRQRRSLAEGRLHPHTAELLAEALGPYWHLPPRTAEQAERRDPGCSEQSAPSC